MKRFYDTVGIEPDGQGAFRLVLDGRVAKTPAKRTLSLPGKALGEAVAAEWAAAAEKIDFAAMPFTGFAFTALDFVPSKREEVVETLAAYAESDLVCYYAEGPESLCERQRTLWTPLSDWLAGRHDIRLQATAGVMPVAQPPEARQRALALLDPLDYWQLTAARALIDFTGSLTIGLAAFEGVINARAAYEAALIDELYQAEIWGEDREAAARRARVAADIEAAMAFNALLMGRPPDLEQP